MVGQQGCAPALMLGNSGVGSHNCCHTSFVLSGVMVAHTPPLCSGGDRPALAGAPFCVKLVNMSCNGASRQVLPVVAEVWQPDDGGCACQCRSGCWTATRWRTLLRCVHHWLVVSRRYACLMQPQRVIAGHAACLPCCSALRACTRFTVLLCGWRAGQTCSCVKCRVTGPLCEHCMAKDMQKRRRAPPLPQVV